MQATQNLGILSKGATFAFGLVLALSITGAAAAETTKTIDRRGAVGTFNSLKLDINGYPVVSYFDQSNVALKVAHCNDPICGGKDTIVTPDAASVGQYTSLALDGAGNPVVSYWGLNDGLKILHCGDQNCETNNSIEVADPSIPSFQRVGVHTSLVLDANGFPVVSYRVDRLNTTGGFLKLLHCGNPNCSSGNSIQTVDSTIDDLGQYTSLVLDAAGNPVISYYDLVSDDLKVAHCNDPNCDPSLITGNGPESITAPDTTGNVGRYTSIALRVGNPIIAYRDDTATDLEITICNDPNCDSSVNGPETVQTLDNNGNVGSYASLALDASGNPVVSYFDSLNFDLKVAHCDDNSCSTVTLTTPVSRGDIGDSTSVQLNSFGHPVITYRDDRGLNLNLLVCDDPNCAP